MTNKDVFLVLLRALFDLVIVLFSLYMMFKITGPLTAGLLFTVYAVLFVYTEKLALEEEE